MALLRAVKGYSPTQTHYTWKEGWRNEPINQDIHPHPPRGDHVE